MTKSNNMFLRSLGVGAILAFVCAYPTMGQPVPDKSWAGALQSRRTEQAPPSNPATPTEPVSEEASKGRSPIKEYQSQLEVRVFKLAYSDPEAIGLVLTTTMKELTVATDKRSRSIVVQGSREKLKNVEALIMQLDTSNRDDKPHLQPVKIRIVWLTEGDEGAAAPAENLKSVIEELHRLGLKKVGQVAQAMVKSQYEDVFQISCSPLLENEPVTLMANGRILAGGNMQVRISANRNPSNRADFASNKLIDINVNTVFNKNDYIVLSVAPIGKITSVFVIQITE